MSPASKALKGTPALPPFLVCAVSNDRKQTLPLTAVELSSLLPQHGILSKLERVPSQNGRKKELLPQEHRWKSAGEGKQACPVLVPSSRAG